jgi:oligosaccharyltransferase complex subunit alpha (ribophorin I)
LTITNLERIIEISHWGNIAVEEHINMRHTGALLNGPFSRYDYQRSQDGLSSIKTFKVGVKTRDGKINRYIGIS